MDSHVIPIALRERRADPSLMAILQDRIATHNRLLAYILSASVYFAIGLYAATKV